jgi:ABC-type cobalamin/Fe3+-siderophores transport system ATPase subunit
MIESLSVKDFTAVPYLETSQLMQNHGGKLRFSMTKPNALVGPNGSGKSALLQALALRFLAFQTGESALDGKYISGHDADCYWFKENYWGHDFQYLKGLTCKSDGAAALYYRPGHIPGNEDGITEAMMMGYFEEAKAYARLVEKKSSGQQAQAVQLKIQELLAQPEPKLAFKFMNWSRGTVPLDLDRRDSFGRSAASDNDYKAEVLRALTSQKESTVPLVMMDEPEQSLDALAEMKLWTQLRGVDSTKVQLIVATHSLYPLLNPKHFNLIETVPGFIKEVNRLTA